MEQNTHNALPVVTDIEKQHSAWKGTNDIEASAGTQPASCSPSSSSNDLRPNALQQSLILLPRAFKNTYRAYPELVGHFLQALILGIVVGITYFQLPPSPSGIQSLKTVSFQLLPVFAYLSQVVWTYKWCMTLVVFDREFEDRLYKPAAWMISELVAWMPMNVFAPFVYALLAYFICGLRKDNLGYYFGIVVVDMILVQFCFVSWALLTASIEVRLPLRLHPPQKPC